MSGDSSLGGMIGGDLGSAIDWVHDKSESYLPGVKQANEKLGLKSSAPEAKTINPNLDAVNQAALLEQNIEGGFRSGAIDEQTRKELYHDWRGGQNEPTLTYEQAAAGIAGIQDRLNTIASGKDLTVNDRIRLNSNIMTLRDRPGRAGLLTGG